ncbi:uncharacterized protein EAE98_002757 [Botrytis deweyae]|uniref:Uncharacterized protein n=1 Tax=Botrytis deweyae TaxID=2478750 RepID=A0ABQ7IUM4_9HELO|nr:uncharacterized protein EAE98_002757 [Botrytis deweyae]KAF7934712.1 hypothetical protein EAE98_002757 [Botrytis deweyae]
MIFQYCFAALAVVTDCKSIWLNGVSYDANFSTVLRMCRVDMDDIASDHNKDPGKRSSYEDSGGEPLPKYLAETIEGGILEPSPEIINSTLLESGGYKIEGLDQVRLILASEMMP